MSSSAAIPIINANTARYFDWAARRRSPSGGAYDFAIDPAKEADRVDVFWLPHLDQSIVLLAHAPPGFSTAATLAGLTSPEQHVVASDGAYFVVRHETGRIIAVMVGGAAAANPLAALIPSIQVFQRAAPLHSGSGAC